MTPKIEEWAPGEPADPAKQNRIFRQLKRYGAFPYEMAASMGASLTDGTKDTATGHKYGQRKWGKGTYGPTPYQMAASIGADLTDATMDSATGNQYGTRKWGKGTYGA